MNKVLLLSLAILILSCHVVKEEQAFATKKEVIIVGAGISGLSAARYLKNEGYQPIILEAQSKVGGRLRTDRSLGVPFDEGASWIHGPVNNPITELANESGMKTFLTNDESVRVYDIDGTEYSDNILDQEEEAYNEILEDINGRKDQSFGEVFYQEYPQYKNQRLWTYMLSAFLEFDTGGDIFKLSSRDFYDDETFEGEDLIATNGYDHVANYLAANLDIRLNTKVTDINYSGGQVAVLTDNGNYTADAVLITVPLGVLKKGVIKFKPELPARTQNAIDGLEMGAVNKFLLVWDDAFWDEKLQYVGITPEEKGMFNYFLNARTFSEANALMTFAFGDYSKKTEQMSDQEVIDQIMVHLRSVYGDNIPEPSKMLRTKWSENPYSYGAYSFATNGLGSDAFEIFEEPIDNRVFFAGEHTIVDYRGTVHGAYLSGIREARKMAKTK